MAVEVTAVDVYGNDTLTIEYRFRDGSNVPVDVSAYTFTSQWRASAAEPASIPFTVDQTNRAAGVVILSMTGEQTASMRRGGVFDLKGTAGATIRTFLRCTTNWTQGVTRA